MERKGGSVTTAYYDVISVYCLCDLKTFFLAREPIPKRQLPPPDVVLYYTDPRNREFLADPQKKMNKGTNERFKLAQRFDTFYIIWESMQM